MENGVFLFYGVTKVASIDIVQAITRTFHMPYISPSTTLRTAMTGSGFEVHMKPAYAEAIVDMILHFEWTKVHYVYDSDEGM